MLLRPPLDGFKAHAHTSGGWVNFWKNAGVGGYHMRQPTLTITRLIKVSVTLSFTNSCIMVAVTNLLNHVDTLWRWKHLPETFPYQYLPFQLFFGQKWVTHAHVPLAPTPPSSFVSVTATLEPLVDHSCSSSQWMHHHHPHPGVGRVTHRGLSSQHYCTQQTHRWQHPPPELFWSDVSLEGAERVQEITGREQRKVWGAPGFLCWMGHSISFLSLSQLRHAGHSYTSKLSPHPVIDCLSRHVKRVLGEWGKERQGSRRTEDETILSL